MPALPRVTQSMLPCLPRQAWAAGLMFSSLSRGSSIYMAGRTLAAGTTFPLARPRRLRLSAWLRDFIPAVARPTGRSIWLAARGSLAAPLTDAERQAKFLDCAAGALSLPTAHQLFNWLEQLASLASVNLLQGVYWA